MQDNVIGHEAMNTLEYFLVIHEEIVTQNIFLLGSITCDRLYTRCLDLVLIVCFRLFQIVNLVRENTLWCQILTQLPPPIRYDWLAAPDKSNSEAQPWLLQEVDHLPMYFISQLAIIAIHAAQLMNRYNMEK